MAEKEDPKLVLAVGEGGEILLCWKDGDGKGFVGEVTDLGDEHYYVAVPKANVRRDPSPKALPYAKKAKA